MRLFLVCPTMRFEVLSYDAASGEAELKMVPGGAIVTQQLDIVALKRVGWKLVKEMDDA